MHDFLFAIKNKSYYQKNNYHKEIIPPTLTTEFLPNEDSNNPPKDPLMTPSSFKPRTNKQIIVKNQVGR